MLNHLDLFHRLILLFHQIFSELVYQMLLYKYFYDNLYDHLCEAASLSF